MCVCVCVAIGIEFISSFYHLFCAFENVRHFHVRCFDTSFFHLHVDFCFPSSLTAVLSFIPRFFLHFHFYFWLTYFNGMWHVHALFRYWKLFTNVKIKIIIKKMHAISITIGVFLASEMDCWKISWTHVKKDCARNWAIAWAITKTQKVLMLYAL